MATVSCREKFVPNSQPCKSTIFAYRSVGVTPDDSLVSCSFGLVNKQLASANSLATFLHSANTNQGAYDMFSKHYYSFRYYKDSGISVLYKTNLEGLVTEATDYEYYYKYEGLLYNAFDKKLYAFKRKTGIVDIALCEISVYGKQLFTKEVLKHIGGSAAYSYITATVDNKTGDIYYQMEKDKLFELYKYSPVSKLATLINNSQPSPLTGLCFNANDDMLYAIRLDSAETNFVKLLPRLGIAMIIDTLPFRPDPKYYSACLDQCDNEYIVSGKITDKAGYFIRLNMAGAIVSNDTTSRIFQGITSVN